MRKAPSPALAFDKAPNNRGLAFDLQSVRSFDIDGRMHVTVANISKANVCGYYGYEIPDYVALGLDQNRLYMMYRDAAELAKAAPTFNNIPLLSRHIAVSADDPKKMDVVGSTGTDAEFDGLFLKNSLVVWDRIAIDGIESNIQREISCSYRYRADMTPGVVDNVAYDGRMLDIRANHVALVEVGRAGPDVVIGDEKPFTSLEYKTMKHSRKAIAIRAALGVFLRPALAQDAAAVDLNVLVRGVTSATIAQDSARIVSQVMAKMPDVDKASLAEVIKLAADAEPDDDKDDDKKKADDEETEEEREERERKEKKADDEEDDKDKPKGMDAAAVKSLVAKARRDAAADFQAIRQAERDVHPLIGEVAAMDSAETVYRTALESAGVALDGVHPSAFRTLVQMQAANKVAQDSAPAPVVAMDAGSADVFNAMWPTAGKVKRSA